MDIREELNGLSNAGYIHFNIKYNNTEENRAVHDTFKDFAKTTTDNHYLLALKALLENYADDFRYESLWDKISRVEAELVNLKEMKEKKESTVPNRFID